MSEKTIPVSVKRELKTLGVMYGESFSAIMEKKCTYIYIEEDLSNLSKYEIDLMFNIYPALLDYSYISKKIQNEIQEALDFVKDTL